LARCAVAVLVVCPKGIPLVLDPSKPRPLFWKLPGGKSEEGETPAEAGVRELDEETGIKTLPKSLGLLVKEYRHDHEYFVFSAKLEETPALRWAGEEGEKIQFFSPKEILEMPDFFPPHRQIVEKILSTFCAQSA